MKKINVEALAAKDASDWAAAQMFYGEGAGNRRKLLEAAIMTKEVQYGPAYVEAFDQAYRSQDMAQHAAQAVAERTALDKAAKRSKNIRAIKSGNFRRMTTGVAVVYVGAIVLHQTGYDKVLWEKTKEGAKKVKSEVNFHRHKAKVVNIYNDIANPDSDEDQSAS